MLLASFVAPSIAGFGEDGPQGRAHDARASAVSTRMCCQTTPPKPRSTGHSDSRDANQNATVGAALAVLVTFAAAKVTRAAQPHGSFAL